MKPSEPYEVRLEMAEMHDTFLTNLNQAMKKKRYIEASWLCYAIFEQRTERLIRKHLIKCPKGKRGKDEKPVGISTKLVCLKKLCKAKYGPYSEFDKDLLTEISAWCKQRNELIHGLVSLEHYRKYDKEVEDLAISGAPLVGRLYKEAAKVREWCRGDHQFEKFPVIKCRCAHRCICEES